MSVTLEDFKQFCKETGRAWNAYANVSLILEFANWVRDPADDGPEVEILRRPVQKLNSPRTAIARIEEEDAG
jgi:hypothetical protein